MWLRLWLLATAVSIVAPPLYGQDANIRTSVEKTSGSSIQVAAGSDDGISVRDTLDAFSETSYVGSLRVIGVSDKSAELAFLDDHLLGSRAQVALRQGDPLYLRFERRPGRDGQLRRPPPTSLAINAELQFASVYDSNIDQDDEPVSSYGLVPAARFMVRSSREDPILSGTYVLARHDYSNSERWTRTSHMGELVFEPSFSGIVRPQTSGQISIRGSSEDRDVSNEYRVDQEIEFRFTRNQRLILYGAMVWKKVPDSPIDDAFKPRTGVVLQQRGEDGRRWELDIRREWNEEQETRGEYDRWKIETSYRFPVSKAIQARAQVEYRIKSYRDRFVEIEEEDYLRKDNRLTIGASAVSEIVRNVSLQVGYRFETRNSNDPDKLFSAHLMMLMLGYRL
ncbi:MAG: outer membrane beta-barrel protein [Rhodothermia bacterium]|nr:outer membrane beta-barrel protein [Rhodothermia bacterium]